MTQEFELQPSPQRYARETERNIVRGTWTPTFTFASPGDLSATYLTQKGYYQRFNNYVVLLFSLSTSSITYTTANGTALITGLPTEVYDPFAGILAIGNCAWGGVTKANYTHLIPYVDDALQGIAFQMSGSGQPRGGVTHANIATGTAPEFIGFVIYLGQ